MPTVIPVGYALVSHFMDTVGAVSAPFVVTYGVEHSGTAPEVAVETCAAYFGSVVEGCCSTNLQLNETWLKEGPSSTGATVISTNTAVGGLTGDMLPPNCAMLVQKKTLSGGRRNRGRFYLPGVRASDVSLSGNISPSQLSDAQEVLDTFLAGLETEAVPMVVLHDTGALAPTVVSQLIAQSLIATQRRRIR